MSFSFSLCCALLVFGPYFDPKGQHGFGDIISSTGEDTEQSAAWHKIGVPVNVFIF